MTASKIHPFLSENVSLRTLQKSVKEDEALLFKKVVPQRLHLSEKQKRCWMKDRNDFGKVIFTDDVRFLVDGPFHFMSWQLKNYTGPYFRVKRPFDDYGVMLHGCLLLDNTVTV